MGPSQLWPALGVGYQSAKCGCRVGTGWRDGLARPTEGGGYTTCGMSCVSLCFEGAVPLSMVCLHVDSGVYLHQTVPRANNLIFSLQWRPTEWGEGVMLERCEPSVTYLRTLLYPWLGGMRCQRCLLASRQNSLPLYGHEGPSLTHRTWRPHTETF